VTKYALLKISVALFLIGSYVAQNFVLLGSLSMLVTQKSADAYMCQSYADNLDQKFISAIELSAVLGGVSLLIALVLLYRFKARKAD